MEVLLISIIVAAASSVGGLIAMLTKNEMKQYGRWIKYSELIMVIIISILMLSFYHKWTILFLLIGALFVAAINNYLYSIHLDRYVRATMFGLGFGILFGINREAAFVFGVAVAIYNIIKGSRIGAYFMSKKKNIFVEIGNFQAIFILSALAGFYFLTAPVLQASILNFAAGAAIATVFGTKL